MSNTIDIVIPTMWHSNTFLSSLERYSHCSVISKIFLVDNNKSNRPISDILSNSKIEIISYGRNIYVNPAWNEGYYRSTANVLCLLNDDIEVDCSIFEYIAALDFSNIDIIGVHLKGSIDNYHIVDHPDKTEEFIKLEVDKSKPIGGQAYAFGVCMFVNRSSYKPIPSLYQIWYGDDYLIQQCEHIFALKTSKIKGEISKTILNLTKNSKTEVQKRIDLDSRNVYRYNHFIGAKEWDLTKAAMKNGIQKPNFDAEYKKAMTTPSDINENLHVLYKLAKECKTVVEMGVRTGVSTRAFLNTDAELLSFDTVLDKEVQRLFIEAEKQGKKVKYIQANVLNIEIDEMDLLFIDTLHTYAQLKEELGLHGNKARKYLVFHDTYTYGLRGEQNDKKGLLTAIIEFMMVNPHWKFKVHNINNNGITVLERTKSMCGNCQER